PTGAWVVVSAWSGSRGAVTRDSDVIELGELALEVHVALELDAALIGATAAGGALAVSPIQRIHNVHTLDDLAERGESHAVELAVVAVIDEELRGTRAGPRRRKAHRTAGIVLTHRVVRNRGVAPGRKHVRIAVAAELRHESGGKAVRARAVEFAALDEVLDTIGDESAVVDL